MHSTYESREIAHLNKRLADLTKLPLRERQANRAEYAGDMATDPELVTTRIEWMLSGDYSYGAYLICKDILQRTRMNRVAILSQMIGGLEWNCSALEARKAYLSLDAPAQTRINDAIQAVIDAATSNDNN